MTAFSKAAMLTVDSPLCSSASESHKATSSTVLDRSGPAETCPALPKSQKQPANPSLNPCNQPPYSPQKTYLQALDVEGQGLRMHVQDACVPFPEPVVLEGPEGSFQVLPPRLGQEQQHAGAHDDHHACPQPSLSMENPGRAQALICRLLSDSRMKDRHGK